MPSRLHDLGDWLFWDRTSGRIVIAQVPNVAMWIVLIALAADLVLPEGRVASAAGDLTIAVSVVWALDEIVRGVNPWRRILGIGVIGGIALWFLRQRVGG